MYYAYSSLWTHPHVVYAQPISPYVLTGYRPPHLTFCACAATLCDVHNETGSIWTHLLGGAVWVAASLDTLHSQDLALRSDGSNHSHELNPSPLQYSRL